MTDGVAEVVYVDQDGSEHPARTIGYPRPGEPAKLVVGGGGLRIVEARYSDEPVPNTWHYPPS